MSPRPDLSRYPLRMSASDLAEVLGLSVKTIQKQARENRLEIPCLPNARGLKFSKARVLQHFEGEAWGRR